MELHHVDEGTFCHLMLKQLEQNTPQPALSSSRRYAIYSPSQIHSDDASLSSDLCDKEWDHQAPDSTASLYSRSSASPSMNDGALQPAASHQHVYVHYRDLEPVESPVTSEMDFASSETYFESDYEPWLVERGVKFDYRQSSHEALMDAREEAIDVMRKYAIHEGKGFYCPRPGCHDRLRDLRALTCHLHIHNVADACDLRSRSDGTYGGGCHFISQANLGLCNILPMNRVRRIISRLMMYRR